MLASAVLARPALGFVTTCHQGITTEALDGAAWPQGAQSPALSPQQALLIHELAIDVAPGVNAFWSLGALIGNYYQDGGPYSSSDVVALADYAARPDLQRTHCLRAPEDDGSAGDAQALAACKAFILDTIAIGLGDGDTPDLEATETVRLHLVFRGYADVPLQRLSFHLGQATHALQDSFSHTFRSADKRQVRTVLNWVDWIKGSSGYLPERDGFQHILALDQCGASDNGGLDRRAAALQATSELLAAVADDQGGRAGRLARAAAVADAWFGIVETCTAANHWCDAPEQTQASAAGCAVAGTETSSRTTEVAMVIMGTLTMLACRPRRPRRRPRRAPVALVAAALALGAAAGARAASDSKPADQPAGADEPESPRGGEVKGAVVKKATPEEQRQLEAHPFGVLVEGGISNDNGGYDVGVGVRYDLGKRVTIGGGVEYNPWVSFETGRTSQGTTQAFAVGIYRLDVRDYLELRITAAAGVSVLMFDTWAAKRGSFGPYFALSPLGIAIRMNAKLRLIIDPAEIVVPIPQTTGIPLAYRQHRFTVAVQMNF